MSLTVACVWVNGHVPFTAKYVVNLHAMCHRWIKRPHRFVCLTDRPEQIPEVIDTVPIRFDRRLKGWWAKVALFDKRVGLTGRVLYLDLDTLLVDSLDDVIDYPAQFALAPHAGDFNGKDGLAVVKRFNSSVMVWDAGTQNFIYDRFSPDVPSRLWGDQDWIGEQCPDAGTMPLEWFPRLSEVAAAWPQMPDGAKVVLCKKPKNDIASRVLRGFAEAWG